jgi:Flp pilus assembly pilin Flp
MTKNMVTPNQEHSDGPDLLEYALLVGLIVLIAVGGITWLDGNADPIFRLFGF